MRFVMLSVLLVSVSLLAEDAPAPAQPVAPPTPASAPAAKPAVAAPPASAQRPMMPFPPGFGRSQNPDWDNAVERLRAFPAPGELSNDRLQASVADVFALTPEQKSAVAALTKDYEKALLEKASKLEQEMKALRDEQEAKIVALLPADKRDSAKKALEFSHAHWMPRTERDAAQRKESMAAQQDLMKVPVAERGAKMQEWNRAARAKQDAEAEETVKAIKAEDAERLDKANRMRMPAMPARPAQPAARGWWAKPRPRVSKRPNILLNSSGCCPPGFPRISIPQNIG